MSTLPASDSSAPVAATGDNTTTSQSADPTPAAPSPSEIIIICGETTGGSKFRPSDWCERLQGALRVLGDEADEVADCVQVVNYNGQKCILVQSQLESIREQVYRFFMSFAKDNNLKKVELSHAQWDALRN